MLYFDCLIAAASANIEVKRDKPSGVYFAKTSEVFFFLAREEPTNG